MNKETELTQNWIDTLFNSGEYTCMGHKFENKTFPVSKIGESHEYVSINPMKKGTTRKGINVTRFSNFLFEMDKYNKREQAELIKRSGLPYSTIVDSGNKSLHFILALEEDLGERSLYTAYFKAINHVLAKFGADIDDGCKDPGRFTRSPFGVNTKPELVQRKPNVHDRVQKVGHVKGRIRLSQVDEWLELNGTNVLEWVETPYVRTEGHSTTSNADIALKFDWIEKYILKTHPSYEEGNYNYQYAMACGLLRAGCTADEVRHSFMSKWNHIHENDPIKGAVQTVKPGEEIYVPTMDERREYYKQLDEAEQLASNREGYNRQSIDLEKIEARPEDIHRYEVVGTEYFKIDSVTDTLIPWSKPMFEKLYGGRNIPSRLYDKFGYKPDYVSDVFPRDLGIDGKTRNQFTRPEWCARLAALPETVDGPQFSTILAALEHGFGAQLQLALEYAAISIQYPEAKLPNLWFIGPENKGKSAVVAIFKYLVGLQNTKKISCKALESDFTDFLGASQLVLIEEAGNWKSPQEAMSNLKDWTTEYDTQWVNPKYGKKYESPIHCKFIFTSNDWDSAPVSGSASRIWFVEVDQEPKNKVTNYYQQIQKEMPHFAKYLIKHIVPQLKRDRNGNLDTTERLYFSPKQYETEAKKFVKSLNKSPIYEGILEQVSDFFEKFPDQDQCYFDFKSIKEACGWKYKGDPNNKQIKLCMKQEWNQETTNTLDRPDSLRWAGNSDDLRPTRKSQWYEFTRDRVIDDVLFSMESVDLV